MEKHSQARQASVELRRVGALAVINISDDGIGGASLASKPEAVCLDTAYPFGIAVFDNAQVRHAFHRGALKLVFAK